MKEPLSVSSSAQALQLLGVSNKNWGWLLGLGVLFIALGTFGIGAAVSLTIVSILFFGWLLIIGGVFQLIQAIKLHSAKGTSLQAVMGVLYIITGLLLVFDPYDGAFAFTIIIAINFIALGILRTIMALFVKGGQGWLWLLLSGIISIGFGIYIFTNLATAALLIIGLFIAIEMLITGWSYVMLAMLVRRESK